MRGVKNSSHEQLTLLELVLQLHGEFRRRLEPIRVTPLQARVLLYLHLHRDAKLTDAATALNVSASVASTGQRKATPTAGERASLEE